MILFLSFMKNNLVLKIRLSVTTLLFSSIIWISGCNHESINHQVSISDNNWNNRFDNHTDWGIYRGDLGGSQYSELNQINTANVHLLEKAWEYEYDGDPQPPGIYSNPIIVDGLLYFNTPHMKTVALNAATGEEVWVFDPSVYNDGNIIRSRSRGVVFWEDEEGNNQRIFSAVRDRVYAMDAKTGELIEPFGQQEDSRFIDLRQNLPIDPQYVDVEITTQGAVYKDYLIIPGRQQEGNVS